jgi:hypothetical protein
MLQKGRDHDHRHASGGSGLPLLNLFWTMFELFLSVLLFRIIIDIFRSQDLGGWGKSLWLIFVIVCHSSACSSTWSHAAARWHNEMCGKPKRRTRRPAATSNLRQARPPALRNN